MSADLPTLIAELEEAERAATSGPWWAEDNYVLANTRELARCYASPDTYRTLPSANARLIALMRTHLPTLIEAVKRQREALRLGKIVMDMLEKHGPSIVPHLLDTDENAGQRFRTALGEDQ